MHAFANRPKAARQAAPDKAAVSGRTHVGQSFEAAPTLHLQPANGNRPARRPSDTEDVEWSAPTAEVPFAGHDLSRIPLRATTPVRIQPKLMVNASGDAYERDADRVAEQVMRMPEPRLQRACECGGGGCSKCKAEQTHGGHGLLQTKPVGTGGTSRTAAPAVVHEVLRSSGQPMAPSARAFFESRFGHDFSGVRVHTDARASEAARAVRAKAFTVGRELVFGQGQYSPETERGRALLAHELTHVVQQSGGEALLQRAENDTVPGCAPLADSQTDVDTKVNTSLATARAAAGSPPSGARVARGVAGDLGTDVQLGRTAIEVWANTLPPAKVSTPAQSATKYAGVGYRLWSNPSFPILNPTMKVNGICIGSDKLGHFFQQGATYFSTQTSSGTPAAEEESERSEGGGYGLASTGVFSNADQEANRQGGRFYSELVARPTMTFAISRYISSRWSEVDNPNYYENSVGHQVWANLLTGGWSGTAWAGVPTVPETLSVTLSATTAGVVTGTFSVVGPSAPVMVPAPTGTIRGTITYNTTTVRGQVPGLGIRTTETPISGILINFDWTLGAASGKGVLNSSGERHLTGTWGRGTSTTDRGSWDINHT